MSEKRYNKLGWFVVLNKYGNYDRCGIVLDNYRDTHMIVIYADEQFGRGRGGMHLVPIAEAEKWVFYESHIDMMAENPEVTQ